MNIYRIINIVSILLIYIISIPIISYLTIKFYGHRNQQIISYRDPKFLLIVINIILYNASIEESINLLIEFKFVHSFPIWTQYLFSFMYIWGCFDVLFLKSYSLFFRSNAELSRITSLRDNISQQSNIEIHDGSIFTLSKIKDALHVFKYTLFPYTFIIIISSIANYQIISNQTLLASIFALSCDILMILCPFMFLLFFMYQISKFYDIQSIQNQIVAQSIFIVIFGTIYGAILIILESCPNIWNLSQNQTENLSKITQSIKTIINFLLLTITLIYYPMYIVSKLHHQSLGKSNNNKNIKNEMDNALKLKMAANKISCSDLDKLKIVSSPTMTMMSRTHTMTTTATTMTNMIECLRDLNLYNKFMAHLVK